MQIRRESAIFIFKKRKDSRASAARHYQIFIKSDADAALERDYGFRAIYFNSALGGGYVYMAIFFFFLLDR